MQQLIPNVSLDEIIDINAKKVKLKDFVVYDIDDKNKNVLKCNYPTRVTGFGIILVLNGSAEVSIGIEHKILAKGNVLFTLPTTVVEFNNLSKDIYLKGIFISNEYLVRLGFHVRLAESLEYLSTNYSRTEKFDENLVKVLKHQLQEIQNLNDPENDNFFFAELIQNHISIIIYELINVNKQFKELQQGQLNNRKEEIVTNFMKLVVSNYKQKRDVQYYADQLFITRKHLTRVITELIQKTPKSIIDETVILEAKLLLKNPNNNLSSVMEELSFEDLPVFSKYFKKLTGKSPLAYKKYQ